MAKKPAPFPPKKSPSMPMKGMPPKKGCSK